MPKSRGSVGSVILGTTLLIASCAPADDVGGVASQGGAEEAAVAGCANVVTAEITATGDTHRISATILSADTGWDKYADAWEVRAPDGTVLGIRALTHPHLDEQPFTRFLNDVVIPGSITEVEVVARDSVVGFCGDTVSVLVPRN